METRGGNYQCARNTSHVLGSLTYLDISTRRVLRSKRDKNNLIVDIPKFLMYFFSIPVILAKVNSNSKLCIFHVHA